MRSAYSESLLSSPSKDPNKEGKVRKKPRQLFFYVGLRLLPGVGCLLSGEDPFYPGKTPSSLECVLLPGNDPVYPGRIPSTRGVPFPQEEPLLLEGRPLLPADAIETLQKLRMAACSILLANYEEKHIGLLRRWMYVFRVGAVGRV